MTMSKRFLASLGEVFHQNDDIQAAAAEKLKTAGYWSCVILGLSFGGAGLVSSRWQHILEGGFYEGFILTAIISIAYFALDMCVAELLGIVPFAGGLFAFVRCSLGPFWGFMTGITEFMVYMFYTIRTFAKMGHMISFMTGRFDLEPLWVLISYMLVGSLHIRGGSVFWNTVTLCTVLSIVVMLVWFGISFSAIDIGYAHLDKEFQHGIYAFMENLHLPMWFYMGICAMPLAGSRVKDATKVIPEAMVSCLVWMTIASVVAIFCVASQYPGISPALFDNGNGRFLLSKSFDHVLHVSQSAVSGILYLPTLGCATGFIFACKNQLATMSESGLMPAVFKGRYGENSVPLPSLLFCCVLQYAVYLIVFFSSSDDQIPFRISCVAACLMYLALFSAFISFRTNFASMKREYVNKLGITGAVIGMIIFLLVFVSIVGFAPGNGMEFVAFFLTQALLVVYYWYVVEPRQYFSKEEQDKFMKAYILNANKRNKLSVLQKFQRRVMTAVFGSSSQHSSGVAAKKRPNSFVNNKVSPQKQQSRRSEQGVLSSKHLDDNITIQKQESTLNQPQNKSIKSQHNVSKSTKSGKSSRERGIVAVTWSGKHFATDAESRKAFELIAGSSSMQNVAETQQTTMDDCENTLPDEDQTEDKHFANDVLVNAVDALPEYFVPVMDSQAPWSPNHDESNVDNYDRIGKDEERNSLHNANEDSWKDDVSTAVRSAENV